ncbi:MAG: hypothetical protein JNK37_06140 [Verrucomicrobiales bacterium]|nr:hypothetical protein [Verrucomicrobiales bacterium]
MHEPRQSLTEPFGKVVGEPVDILDKDPFETYRRIVVMGRQLRSLRALPRGVYRFKTFEAADQWEKAYTRKTTPEN